MTATPATFSYHRAVAPTMWMFVAIAGTEMVVVHGLVATRWPWLALAMTAVTLPAILWFVAGIRAMRRLPVLVEPDRLVLRTGKIKAATVPIADVVTARGVDGLPSAERRRVLNLALIAQPNIVVELSRPVGRRGRLAVAHRLDDPAGFLAAVERLRAGR